MTLAYDPAASLGIPQYTGDAFVPPDLLLYGNFPFITDTISVGVLKAPLPAYTLIGIVSETGIAVPSVATATDGSQNPVGVTLQALPADTVAQNVSFYRAGGFNIKRLNMDASWTLAALNLAMIKAYAPLFFGVPTSLTDPNQVTPVADLTDLVS